MKNISLLSRVSILSLSALATLASAQVSATPTEIVAHMDFQCPFSLRHFGTLKQLQEKYGNQVEVRIQNFPLSFHTDAELLAKAQICANEEAALGDYTAYLFEAGKASGSTVDQLADKFAELGGAEGSFRDCLAADQTSEKLKEEIAAAEELEVNSTPTTFVGGKKIAGALPIEDFEKLINAQN
jgi:protein-disulfide isomerase